MDVSVSGLSEVANIQIQSEVSTAVERKVLDQIKSVGQQELKLIESTSAEGIQSIGPKHVDAYA